MHLRLTDYFSDLSSSDVVKEVVVDVNKPYEKVREQIREYARTVSPLRVELYNCHGSMEEFDQKSSETEYSGLSSYCISDDYSIQGEGIYTMRQ